MNRNEFLRLLAASAGATAALAACGDKKTTAAAPAPAATVAAAAAPQAPEGDEAMRDKLLGHLLDNTRGLFEMMGIVIGDRLGLYAALAATPARTSTELAQATSTNERYVREWLEHQCVSGILTVEDETADARARRFSLPKGHAEALIDVESVNYITPLLRLALATSPLMPELVAAYRSGRGIPWSAYGAEARDGQGGANRATYLRLLGKEWLPQIKAIDERLKADPPARVADMGCGLGWSSIAIAQAYPKVKVDGYDIDGPSIEAARANAKAAGVADRVSFHKKSAYDPDLPGGYDLAAAFEMVHDLSRPVTMLAAMRRMVGTQGAVLVVDERVAEAFSAKADDVERMMYGWSIVLCLPTGKDDHVSAETGTVMRPKVLQAYAAEAGLSHFEILPIDNYFFRLYLLKA